MKKKVIALVAALLVLCLALTACGGGTKLIMGTGSETGTYYGFGGVLGQVIGKNTELSVTAVSTGGSKENILNIKAGSNQLGTVQNDVMSYAYNGTNTFAEEGAIDSFRVIAGLYAEQVQIVTLDPSIKTVADLAGKSVSIGVAGSGVYFNAIDILGAYGLTEEDINAQYLSFGDSTESMKDGKIDAAFIVAGAPTTAISDLATSNEVHLVAIDDEHAAQLMAACPYYTQYTIPAGTYNGLTEDVKTVTVKATLIVSAKCSEEDVYNLTKAIFDHIDDITAGHSKGAELSLENAVEGIDVPFHAGAAKYFAEQGITVPTAD